MADRPHGVVNEREIPWAEQQHGERFEVRRKQLGAAAGGEKLGCSLFEMPPGKKGWPFHYHLANEEALYVLAGSGTLRLGEREVPVGAGDYVALPVGAGHAHQLINTGAETLRYLAFSTMIQPDVMVYPDSDKIGVFAGAAPGGPKEARTFGAFLRNEPVDYWDDEV
ncbi:cupin domain-containing protein [Vulgatibacter sp.]|uniref:cupin domain-containing protein n=1 Tax=Vulgatibacter sp. TaxID=1971226 RepID=UPI00356A8374